MSSVAHYVEVLLGSLSADAGILIARGLGWGFIKKSYEQVMFLTAYIFF